MRKVPVRSILGILQQILVLGRKHWDNNEYDPNARRRFKRALQCKTGELGTRLYRSSTQQEEFPNTCKSPACASCGHGAMIHWRRQRWCALPEGPYCAVTFTMPAKLWPLFAANPQLCRRLPEIAAGAVISYGRVHKGMELGVMPIMQTFNGPLDFNPHVHLLVTARDLQLRCFKKWTSFYFDGNAMACFWRRLVVELLRAALLRSESGVACHEVQQMLDRAANEFWMPAHVRRFRGKRHFLEYAGRYVRRPPIASRRIISVTHGMVRFWYKDKRRKQRIELTSTVEEFIDRWARHIPQPYQHGIRYFGLFAPRIWGRIGASLFAILGERPRPQPARQRWATSLEKFGRNPLLDGNGELMRFVRHLPPKN